jgi:hypothetical protein
VLADVKPPRITVLNPEENKFYTDAPSVLLEATVVDDVSPNNELQVVINTTGQLVQTLVPDAQGRIKLAIQLVNGTNLITITATDGVGNSSTVKLEIVRSWLPLELLAAAGILIVGGVGAFLMFREIAKHPPRARAKVKPRRPRRRKPTPGLGTKIHHVISLVQAKMRGSVARRRGARRRIRRRRARR